MTTNQKKNNNFRFAFFGTSHIATMMLEELARAELWPSLVVTMPPRKKGRGLQEIETDVAQRAKSAGIALAYDWHDFENDEWDVAVVVDYGKILPPEIIDLPKKGFLNVHPSLLPRLRGASPIRSAILNGERETGVSIIKLDEEMDHGPLVAQKRVQLERWPLRNSELERILMPAGGTLLAQILPEYVAGNVEPVPQNHDLATYCMKLTKEDGHIDLNADAQSNLRKVYALEGWPGTYAFFERSGKEIRVMILDAIIENGEFVPTRVKPEGKNEMSYEDFLRSGAKPL